MNHNIFIMVSCNHTKRHFPFLTKLPKRIPVRPRKKLTGGKGVGYTEGDRRERA